jgi:tRNA 2-thiouridine synthesizing protein E
MTAAIAVDKDGYLKRLDDWNEDVAVLLAEQEGIMLTPAHWEIIHGLRDFYEKHQLSPATRALVRFVAQEFGKDKGNSIYLMKLFPGNPALKASKIAGLPRPRNCF